MTQMRAVACPSCGALVEWKKESPFRPFCSERCRLIDLGAWAAESYRVPVDDQKADRDDPPDKTA
ncbi:MAG: DNA gyrase inhibitor YacG [Betaproteobacteria bacterium]|nr:MAG: DNA gyrase inhibitor YacG [Betaproteobacteria bacterium]